MGDDTMTMFDPTTIRHAGVFYIVDSDGSCWTDTTDLPRAENLAAGLAATHKGGHLSGFYVVDAYQIRFEATIGLHATSSESKWATIDDSPFILAFGAVWRERPAATCAYFLLCNRPAETMVWNPILGDVPTCGRCAEKVDRLKSDRR